MNESTAATQNDCCPYCGAAIVSSDNQCWLCFTSLGRTPSDNPYLAPADAPTPARQSGSTLLLIVTLAAVCLVLMAMAPGLGVLGAVFVAPAIVRTSLLLQRRAKRGKPVGWFQRVATFLGSLAVLIVLVTVVTVGALGTFCLVVIGAISVPRLNEQLALAVAGLAGIAVAVGFVLLFVKLTAQQLRED